MKFNCVHSFSLEARDQEEFERKISDYGGLVRKASEKLGIGYGHCFVAGQPAASDRYETTIKEDEGPLERLFEG